MMSCTNNQEKNITNAQSGSYFDYSNSEDQITGGIKMIPTYMEWMSTQVQKGRSVTTNGSHISQYDDAEGYFSGLIKFIKDVNEGNF